MQPIQVKDQTTDVNLLAHPLKQITDPVQIKQRTLSTTK
jgi:hypothetical protein